MKKFVLAASTALLIASPSLSLAQDEHHQGGGHPGGSAPPQIHAYTPPPSHIAPTPQAAPQYHGAPQVQVHGGQPGVPVYQGPSFPGGQGGYRPQPGQSGYHGPTFPSGQGGYRPQPGPPGYAGGPSGGGYRGFNPSGPIRSGGQGFAYGGRQFFRYRAAPYRYPGGYYGWANHGWRRGEWLPPVFITPGYFINDWSDFGLWQPTYGYEWIRVGADAVLVNLADGQVVDVVPGIYYD